MSASTLKIIALITMLIDHIGYVFFPQHLYLRMIGRIAFPIYAFFVAKGCQYSKNKIKYLVRLFIFALISQIPFDLAFNTNISFFQNTNVIYTMFLSSFAILSCQYIYNLKINIYIKYLINIIIILLIGSLTEILSTDYGAWGFTLILSFYYLRNYKNFSYLVAIFLIIYKFDFRFPYLMLLCNILPIFLLYFYNNKKGYSLKWLFYISYPLHLIIIEFFKIYLWR